MRPRLSRPSAALTAILAAGLAATAAVAAAPPQTAATSLPAPTVQRKAFVAVPGPDAEYLSLSDRYALLSDGAVVHERRSRLQVNSYLAINRKYGETKVGYDPAVETFEVLLNRTVVPSGQTVEAPANAIVDDQPPGADHDPLWAALRRKVIVHTALEPGAVIEEAWRVTRAATAAPWLELAEAIALEPPVRVRTIEVDIPAGTPLRWEATGWIQGPPRRESAAGRDLWRWTFDNVQAFPPEPGAPSEPPSIIASTCPGRRALATEFNRRAGNPAGDPEELVALARQVDAKTPGDEARVLAVLDAVAQAVVVAQISPSQQSWRPRPLADVWRTGVATPLELAGLQAAALHAVGSSTTSAAVAGNDQRDLERCPAFAGLDRVFVMVRWGSEGTRLYDPVKPVEGGPLEATTSTRSLLAVYALDAMPGTLVWNRSNSRRANLVLDVAPDGGLKGTLESGATDDLTPHAALVRDPAKFARELAALLPDGKATNVRVTELRRNAASLLADVEGRLPARNGLGLVRWTLPDFPGGVESKLPPPPAPGRLSPIALPAPCNQTLEMVLLLPKGWVVAALPSTVAVSNDAGTVATGGQILPDGRVRLTRLIELRLPIVQATEAAQVRALLTAWLSPAGRELLLRLPEESTAKHAP
ncbi:MAG: DUF3857 domain-containing protein [Acidobacteriia bacterium]|nr:DUF3857 domain-containing protein [Terriglobia bacterium]